MPSPFSRTIRSIDADSFRASVAGLIVAFLVISAWCAWFFMARVSIYKVSPKAWVTGEETVTSEFFRNYRRSREIREAGIVALFPPEDMADIRPGQEATLYLKKSGQVRSLPAKVIRVVRQGDKERLRVELSTQLDINSQVRLRKGDVGEIKIAVDHISPAIMVMRTSGLFADTPGISVSPRNNSNQQPTTNN